MGDPAEPTAPAGSDMPAVETAPVASAEAATTEGTGDASLVTTLTTSSSNGTYFEIAQRIPLQIKF